MAENTGGATGVRPIWAVLMVAIAFTGGAGWQFLEVREAKTIAEDLQSELTTTQSELSIQRAMARLGFASRLATEGRYEDARRTASDFFAGLQDHVITYPETPGELKAALARRDDIITGLSRDDPASGVELASMLQTFSAALGYQNTGGPVLSSAVDTAQTQLQPPPDTAASGVDPVSDSGPDSRSPIPPDTLELSSASSHY